MHDHHDFAEAPGHEKIGRPLYLFAGVNSQEGNPEQVDHNYRAIQPVDGGDGEGKGHFGGVVRRG